MAKVTALRWLVVLLVLALLTGCAASGDPTDVPTQSLVETTEVVPTQDTVETTNAPTQDINGETEESTIFTGPIELPVIPG